MPLPDDLAIVIRSVGERTEACCLALAREQVLPENVVLIRERPFGAAVRKTFQVGLDLGCRWTLALDADVLLRARAVEDMLAWARLRGDSFFFANFSILDKLRGSILPGGGHLYRTSRLPEALRHASEEIDAHKRPESLVRARMHMAGHLSCQVEGLVVGLHDFEQSYRDIYRTAYVHRLKHPPGMMEPCLAAWKRLAPEDADFRVALIGAEAAAAKGGEALIDDRVFPRSIEAIEGLEAVREKAPLGADALDGEEIARRMGAFSPFPECLQAESMGKNAERMLQTRPPFRVRFGAVLAETGWARLPLWLCGSLLHRTGTGMLRLARRRAEDDAT